MKAKLYYITNGGCTWFEKEVDLTLDNYKRVIKDYHSKHVDEASELVRKWNLNGEDEALILDFEFVGEFDKTLYRKVFSLLEKFD